MLPAGLVGSGGSGATGSAGAGGVAIEAAESGVVEPGSVAESCGSERTGEGDAGDEGSVDTVGDGMGGLDEDDAAAFGSGLGVLL